MAIFSQSANDFQEVENKTPTCVEPKAADSDSPLVRQLREEVDDLKRRLSERDEKCDTTKDSEQPKSDNAEEDLAAKCRVAFNTIKFVRALFGGLFGATFRPFLKLLNEMPPNLRTSYKYNFAN